MLIFVLFEVPRSMSTVDICALRGTPIDEHSGLIWQISWSETSLESSHTLSRAAGVHWVREHRSKIITDNADICALRGTPIDEHCGHSRATGVYWVREHRSKIITDNANICALRGTPIDEHVAGGDPLTPIRHPPARLSDGRMHDILINECVKKDFDIIGEAGCAKNETSHSVKHESLPYIGFAKASTFLTYFVV
ncbi:hypothetical protein J6590_034838 [Homalodisca vitripennis]|nr:hypothetical protein J6590_034838 [Homalodisca vitripennis]